MNDSAYRGHVLHLEDSPDIAALVQQMLETVGYRVEIVSTCDAFFGVIGRKVPDVFLLDVQLPDGNGLDVLQQIRASREYDGVPAIVLTSEVGLGTALEGFDRGANAFLVKMPSSKRLIATMEYLLAERRQKNGVRAISSAVTTQNL